MNRRQLLKLLASGVVGSAIDVDRLLWVPTKTIFLPSQISLSHSQILLAEWNRIIPLIKQLFEKDDTFYKILKYPISVESIRPIKIPLEIRPGLIDWGKALVIDGKKDVP